MKTVILVNVGTPLSPEPEDVGVYLNEFLMDENIISIPRPFRDILVKVIIVPRRKFSSSEKYKKIWTKAGSPLMVESENIKTKLQSVLGSEWNVVIGMQVGQPSLKEVLRNLGSDELYFCPLYPQFATATTGGALQALQKRRAKILKPFYAESWFIRSVASQIRKNLKPEDHLLLSYHGLPVSQLKQKNSFCYQRADCCERNSSDLTGSAKSACELNCYKAQCLRTTQLLQKELGHQRISTCFQSRLGRAQWIEPSTEDVMKELVANGVKNLKVACPSFVADCLETLEEIGLELRSDFLSLGGESFELIPSVNDQDEFIQGLAAAIKSM